MWSPVSLNSLLFPTFHSVFPLCLLQQSDFLALNLITDLLVLSPKASLWPASQLGESFLADALGFHLHCRIKWRSAQIEQKCHRERRKWRQYHGCCLSGQFQKHKLESLKEREGKERRKVHRETKELLHEASKLRPFSDPLLAVFISLLPQREMLSK